MTRVRLFSFFRRCGGTLLRTRPENRQTAPSRDRSPTPSSGDVANVSGHDTRSQVIQMLLAERERKRMSNRDFWRNQNVLSPETLSFRSQAIYRRWAEGA